MRLLALASIVCLASTSFAEEKARDDDDLGLELARISRLPTQDGRTQSLRLLLGRWVALDVEAARVTVETWPDAAARPGLLGVIACCWGERAPIPALEWARSLPRAERFEAVFWAIRRLGSNDARQARAELLRLKPGELRDKVAVQLVGEMGRGRELAEWCAAYPEADVSLTLVRHAARAWTMFAITQPGDRGERADVNAETELIEAWAWGLPDARLRDQALAGALDGFCRLLYLPDPPRNPEPLRRLLRSLDDEALRAEVSTEVGLAWLKAFPDNVGNPASAGR